MNHTNQSITHIISTAVQTKLVASTITNTTIQATPAVTDTVNVSNDSMQRKHVVTRLAGDGQTFNFT